VDVDKNGTISVNQSNAIHPGQNKKHLEEISLEPPKTFSLHRFALRTQAVLVQDKNESAFSDNIIEESWTPLQWDLRKTSFMIILDSHKDYREGDTVYFSILLLDNKYHLQSLPRNITISIWKTYPENYLLRRWVDVEIKPEYPVLAGEFKIPLNYYARFSKSEFIIHVTADEREDNDPTKLELKVPYCSYLEDELLTLTRSNGFAFYSSQSLQIKTRGSFIHKESEPDKKVRKLFSANSFHEETVSNNETIHAYKIRLSEEDLEYKIQTMIFNLSRRNIFIFKVSASNNSNEIYFGEANSENKELLVTYYPKYTSLNATWVQFNVIVSEDGYAEHEQQFDLNDLHNVTVSFGDSIVSISNGNLKEFKTVSKQPAILRPSLFKKALDTSEEVVDSTADELKLWYGKKLRLPVLSSKPIQDHVLVFVSYKETYGDGSIIGKAAVVGKLDNQSPFKYLTFLNITSLLIKLQPHVFPFDNIIIYSMIVEIDFNLNGERTIGENAIISEFKPVLSLNVSHSDDSNNTLKVLVSKELARPSKLFVIATNDPTGTMKNNEIRKHFCIVQSRQISKLATKDTILVGKTNFCLSYNDVVKLKENISLPNFTDPTQLNQNGACEEDNLYYSKLKANNNDEPKLRDREFKDIYATGRTEGENNDKLFINVKLPSEFSDGETDTEIDGLIVDDNGLIEVTRSTTYFHSSSFTVFVFPNHHYTEPPSYGLIITNTSNKTLSECNLFQQDYNRIVAFRNVSANSFGNESLYESSTKFNFEIPPSEEKTIYLHYRSRKTGNANIKLNVTCNGRSAINSFGFPISPEDEKLLYKIPVLVNNTISPESQVTLTFPPDKFTKTNQSTLGKSFRVDAELSYNFISVLSFGLYKWNIENTIASLIRFKMYYDISETTFPLSSSTKQLAHQNIEELIVGSSKDLPLSVFEYCRDEFGSRYSPMDCKHLTLSEYLNILLNVEKTEMIQTVLEKAFNLLHEEYNRTWIHPKKRGKPNSISTFTRILSLIALNNGRHETKQTVEIQKLVRVEVKEITEAYKNSSNIVDVLALTYLLDETNHPLEDKTLQKKVLEASAIDGPDIDDFSQDVFTLSDFYETQYTAREWGFLALQLLTSMKHNTMTNSFQLAIKLVESLRYERISRVILIYHALVRFGKIVSMPSFAKDRIQAEVDEYQGGSVTLHAKGKGNALVFVTLSTYKETNSSSTVEELVENIL